MIIGFTCLFHLGSLDRTSRQQLLLEHRISRLVRICCLVCHVRYTKELLLRVAEIPPQGFETQPKYRKRRLLRFTMQLAVDLSVILVFQTGNSFRSLQSTESAGAKHFVSQYIIGKRNMIIKPVFSTHYNRNVTQFCSLRLTENIAQRYNMP